MCTAISWPGSVHCFGRNLDLERSYGEVVAVTPRNYPLPLRNGETLRRHHAMIGMAHVAVGYPLYYEATNERGLSMAGLMIIQGVGMVFLVLAILWMVLLIFKKVFYKDPAKQEKKEEATAEAPAPVAAPAPADDGALVAAITAAVAAYIDSDPALSSQFAGGFRVVSFKKKNGKTSWNH